MKQIQAVIRPEKLDDVKDALVGLNINGLTAVPVQGFGKQLGHAEVYRGVKIEAKLLPKVMITILANDEIVPTVVEAIQKSARTGEVGDGKIVILNLEDVIRIRTGESGPSALS